MAANETEVGDTISYIYLFKEGLCWVQTSVRTDALFPTPGTDPAVCKQRRCKICIVDGSNVRAAPTPPLLCVGPHLSARVTVTSPRSAGRDTRGCFIFSVISYTAITQLWLQESLTVSLRVELQPRLGSSYVSDTRAQPQLKPNISFQVPVLKISLQKRCEATQLFPF